MKSNEEQRFRGSEGIFLPKVKALKLFILHPIMRMSWLLVRKKHARITSISLSLEVHLFQKH